MVAHHFKINEYSIRTIIKQEKEIHEGVTTATPAGAKTLYFCKISLHLKLECSFHVGAWWLEERHTYDSNMTKRKVVLWHLKAKDEGSKAGEFNPSKGWFNNFRKKFGFKNVKRTEDKLLPMKRQWTNFQTTLNKTLRTKDIYLNRFLMQMNVWCSRGENATKDMY